MTLSEYLDKWLESAARPRVSRRAEAARKLEEFNAARAIAEVEQQSDATLVN